MDHLTPADALGLDSFVRDLPRMARVPGLESVRVEIMARISAIIVKRRDTNDHSERLVLASEQAALTDLMLWLLRQMGEVANG